MTPLETLLSVFGILIVSGASYEIYNETKSHHRTKHYRERSRNHRDLSISKSNKSRSKNDFFGLFKKSRKNKSQKSLLKDFNNKKVTEKSNNKLFHSLNKTRHTKHTSPDNRKKTSFRKRKNTTSMDSLEKRQYYLNKFKHNVHKTKKRRRRIYI
jgi:hypothetical protein